MRIRARTRKDCEYFAHAKNAGLILLFLAAAFFKKRVHCVVCTLLKRPSLGAFLHSYNNTHIYLIAIKKKMLWKKDICKKRHRREECICLTFPTFEVKRVIRDAYMTLLYVCVAETAANF